MLHPPKGLQDPRRRLSQLLEASRTRPKYLNTLIMYSLSNHKSGAKRAINTTLESLLKA